MSYNIGIALSYHNRYSYLRITLASLKEALRSSNHQLHIINDASTDPYVPEILSEIKCNYYTNKENKGPYKAGYHLLDSLFQITDHDYLFVIDSDCIIHPKLFEYSIMNDMIVEYHDLYLGSFFNSLTHKVIEERGLYHIKESAGGLGVLVPRDKWIEFRQSGADFHKGWDWNYVKWINHQDGKIVCTRDSYIEHFGQTGSHSDVECNIDKAKRFLEQ